MITKNTLQKEKITGGTPLLTIKYCFSNVIMPPKSKNIIAFTYILHFFLTQYGKNAKNIIILDIHNKEYE